MITGILLLFVLLYFFMKTAEFCTCKTPKIQVQYHLQLEEEWKEWVLVQNSSLSWNLVLSESPKKINSDISTYFHIDKLHFNDSFYCWSLVFMDFSTVHNVVIHVNGVRYHCTCSFIEIMYNLLWIKVNNFFKINFSLNRFIIS